MTFGLQKTLPSLSKILFLFSILFACIVFGLIFSLKWKIALALLFLLLFLLLNFYSLQLGIIPVFFAIPFDRLGKITPESPITFAKILIGLLIITWLMKILLARDPRPISLLKQSPIFILSLLFIVFSLLSVINARHLEIFVLQNVRRISNVILLFLIINIVHRKEFLIKILGVILLAYIFVGFTGIYEMNSGESILKTVWGEEDVGLEYTLQSGAFRIGGPGGDPDFLAISVIFPTLIATMFLAMLKSRPLKILLVLFILLMLVNMVATGSRGGLFSLLIGGAVFWFFTKMKWKYTTALLGALLLIIIIASFTLINTDLPVERFTGETGGQSIIYRIGWSKIAFSMIKDHPFVGIGTGNYPKEYNRYARTIPEVPRDPYWTHNSFLQSWAENGILGLLVYAALFLFSAKMMLTVIRNTKDETLRSLAVLLLSVVTAYFFFAATSNVLENENYFIIFAFTTVVYQFSKSQLPWSAKPKGDMQEL